MGDIISEYIEMLEHSEFERYLEGDKTREVGYIKFHSYRFREILKSIPVSESPLRLLDIGTSPFTILIKRMYPHYEIWTVDRTSLLQERCSKEGVLFKVCDLNDSKLPFDNSYFDVVIFTEVLEHICAPPSLILKDVKRVLRSNGKLILSVPNIAAFHKRIKLLVGKNILPWPDRQLDRNKVHGYGHLHEYTMKEIEKILKDVGFSILTKKYLQFSVIDAWQSSQYLGESLKLRLGMVLSILPGYLLPSLRSTIYLECINPD